MTTTATPNETKSPRYDVFQVVGVVFVLALILIWAGKGFPHPFAGANLAGTDVDSTVHDGPMPMQKGRTVGKGLTDEQIIARGEAYCSKRGGTYAGQSKVNEDGSAGYQHGCFGLEGASASGETRSPTVKAGTFFNARGPGYCASKGEVYVSSRNAADGSIDHACRAGRSR